MRAQNNFTAIGYTLTLLMGILACAHSQTTVPTESTGNTHTDAAASNEKKAPLPSTPHQANGEDDWLKAWKQPSEDGRRAILKHSKQFPAELQNDVKDLRAALEFKTGAEEFDYGALYKQRFSINSGCTVEVELTRINAAPTIGIIHLGRVKNVSTVHSGRALQIQCKTRRDGPLIRLFDGHKQWVEGYGSSETYFGGGCVTGPIIHDRFLEDQATGTIDLRLNTENADLHAERASKIFDRLIKACAES